MDSIFNIGGPELVFILLLAGIVMGPKRIQMVARWLGRMTAQLQAISRGFARQLNAELAAVDEGGELKGSFNEIQELRRQLNELKKEITSVAMAPMNEMRSTMDEARQIMSPALAAKKEMETAVNTPPLAADDDTTPPAETAEETVAGNDDIILPSPPFTLPSLIDIADDPE